MILLMGARWLKQYKNKGMFNNTSRETHESPSDDHSKGLELNAILQPTYQVCGLRLILSFEQQLFGECYL